MPPMLALAIWIVLLLALLVFDPAKEPKVSGVIWIPVIWMAIAGRGCRRCGWAVAREDRWKRATASTGPFIRF